MSTNNYFNIYLSQVFALAETLVIKSKASARGINQQLINYYGDSAVNASNKRTWKYYLNLAGEYHPVDTKMKIISLDTLEEIEFSKENLVIHRATAREYQYGTRHYLELVNRFPLQEQLILGILYPCDLDTAILAEDNTILSYPKHLVEFNEYSLITKLQSWVFLYRKQFQNPQYSVSDEYFEAALLAMLYMQLPNAILNLRLRACRTNEAHSYHVRCYLASHGFLDDYLDHLTTKQALWCYRNINYIERYSGHRDTFEWLIENVFTERDIPVGEYTMRHDLTLQPNGVEAFDPENYHNGIALRPAVVFKKKALNPVAAILNKSPLDLDTLFQKQDPIARDNERYRDDDKAIAKIKMENSLSNVLMTKVLESAMYDYTDSDTYTLSQILVNQWIHRAFNGSYKAAIVATNPVTGERIPLSSKEAIYLLYYCFRMALGQEANHIPVFVANRVPRAPIPSYRDLRKHVDLKRIPTRALKICLDLMPLIGTAYSIEQFSSDCQALWVAANRQDRFMSVYDHMEDRAYIENVINRIYCVRRYAPPSKILYTDWLNSKSINLDNFTPEQYQALFKSLLDEGTGVNLYSTLSTRSLQKAMVNLFSQLSSYSIHFITDINKSNIVQMGGNRIRLGDRNVDLQSVIYVTELEVEVLEANGSVKQSVEMDSNTIDATDPVDVEVQQEIDWELPKLFDNNDSVTYRYEFMVPISRIALNYEDGVYPNKYNTAPMWRNEDLLNRHESHSYKLLDTDSVDYGCSRKMTLAASPIGSYFPNGLPGFRPFTPEIRNNFGQYYLPGFDEPGNPIGNNIKPLNGFKEPKPEIRNNFRTESLNGFKPLGVLFRFRFKGNSLPGFDDFLPVMVEDLVVQKGHIGIAAKGFGIDVYIRGELVLEAWKLDAGHYRDENGNHLTGWDALKSVGQVIDYSSGVGKTVYIHNRDYNDVKYKDSITKRPVNLDETTEPIDLHPFNGRTLDGF